MANIDNLCQVKVVFTFLNVKYKGCYWQLGLLVTIVFNECAEKLTPRTSHLPDIEGNGEYNV